MRNNGNKKKKLWVAKDYIYVVQGGGGAITKVMISIFGKSSERKTVKYFVLSFSKLM